jgi:hypothetical protein
MKSLDNYINSTPIYKIWVDIIDISISTFSEVLSERAFYLKEVFCDRTGVHIFYMKENDLLEIHYNQIQNGFYCTRKNINSGEFISIGYKSRVGDGNNKIKSRADLINEIIRWKDILVNEIQ